MFLVHRKVCTAYYRKQDVRAIEHHPEMIGECKTKVILLLTGKKEAIYVKESPEELFERMNKSK